MKNTLEIIKILEESLVLGSGDRSFTRDERTYQIPPNLNRDLSSSNKRKWNIHKSKDKERKMNYVDRILKLKNYLKHLSMPQLKFI